MNRLASLWKLWLLMVGGLILVAGCDVPSPPPELRAPTTTPARRADQLTVTPVPPTATEPANGGGTIWFVRQGTLWQAGPDGANPLQRSTRPIHSAPAPAPDGRQVAFLSGQDVVVYDVARGAERVVATGNLPTPQRLAWSPDSAQLAYFVLGDTPGEERVEAVTLDGIAAPRTMATIMVRGYRTGPSFERVACWEPDGRRFAYSGLYGPIQVQPLSATAGDPFTVNGGEPDWAPNNRYLLYTETLNGALAVFDAVGVAATPFVNEKREVGTRLGEYAQGPGARYAPDGSQMVYRSRTGDGSPAVAARDTTGVESLFLPGNNPAWSPDGGWIVFETGGLTQQALGAAWQATGIAKVRPDGSEMAQILQDGSLPAWGR
jgi:Tol biopolymer transport system component